MPHHDPTEAKMKFTSMLVIVMATIFLSIATSVFATDATSQGQQAGQPSAAIQRACRADVKRFCKEIKPGEGRIIACLKASVTKLSQECAARLDKTPAGPPQEQEEGYSGGY
jgi:hypothetical protein